MPDCCLIPNEQFFFLLSHGETKLHFDEMMMTSPFNKTKGVIRNRKSNDRQHNGQTKKNKRTNNNLQNITHETKDLVTRTPFKTGGELRCSGGKAVLVPLNTDWLYVYT